MENLAEMVKNPKIENNDESNKDFNFGDQNSEEILIKDEASPVAEVVKTCHLNEWFEHNREKFENINQVKVSSSGIDPNKVIVVKVPLPSGELDDDGNLKQKLFIFDDTDKSIVLDLPGKNMNVFNSGFQIIYDYNEEISIKCYGVKTSLIVVFCHKINEKLIPYHIIKMKKEEEELNIFRNSINEVNTKLSQNAEIENIKLLYKQIKTDADNKITNEDFVNWFLKRQSEITDINHLLQIDSIIIKILG